jgi:predicted NAD/FAD-binding protein
MALLTNNVPRKKVYAIIGSGCAGIGALWALNRTHHDVYIYEAAERLGGHTNTVEFKHGKSKTLVDTGFIVLNTATYRRYLLRRCQLQKLILCSQFHCLLENYRRIYSAN